MDKDSIVSSSPSAQPPPCAEKLPFQLLFLWAFLGLWFGQLFLALLPTWTDGTYYDYGLLVPPIAVMMFVTRWNDLTGQCDPRNILNRASECLRSPLVWGAGIICFPAVTTLRLVESIDSGWRAPLYAHWMVVWVFALILLSQIVGWRKAFFFVPILLVTFLGVPLPSTVEFSLIHSLTDRVIDTAVAINRFAGFPLDVAGQTIFANGIPLQVSEGCSGIRSFQSSIFAGFVVGELLKLSWPIRVFLLLVSGLVAFAGNSARVIFLVRHAFNHGDENLQKLHDTSGYVSLSISLAAILGIGYLFGRIRESREGK